MDERHITRQAVYQVLSEYWHQYKKYPWRTALAFFLPALGNILIFFVPPLVIAQLVNMLAAHKVISIATVGMDVVFFGGSRLLGEFLWRVGMHIVIKMENEGLTVLTKSVFERLMARDYDFYTNNFVGTLSKKALGFARGFEAFTDTLIFNVTGNIFPLLFAVVILWRYSPVLPIALLFWLSVTVAIIIPIVRKRSKLVAMRHDASSKMAGRISDALTNILAVKSFAREEDELQTFGTVVEDVSAKWSKAANYQNLRVDTVTSPLYVLTNIIGLIAAIFFTQTLGLQAGIMVVVFTYYSQITGIFWQINQVYRGIESSIGEAAEFTQMLIDPAKVLDVEKPGILEAKSGNIQFNDVGFSYDSEKHGDALFLKNFNLNIKANQKVGLVGPSGGGKTTITKLLLRFIDLQDGTITIDGQDISQVTQRSLRETIAYVPQEPLLFHRSLFENIAYGDSNATEEDVIRVAKIAHADEFISTLSSGYQTLVGERGVKLSGGQRQRVAIARALLKKSPILVLDEATSSLDSESEKYIQEGLWELMKDKTALVIAHRLSTIKHLDRIIVLADGKVVQDGTHDELIKQDGLYATLWNHQSGGFLED